MPSELVTKGFWVRMTRYEGFHAVMTVNRWVLASNSLGTGAYMPPGLSSGGFWVLVPGVRVLTFCHDCQQVGSWF